MLAQFQRLHPNGSLTSELVEIFQGKYIVRASVQIEGVIRATGMAGAETIEAAEDQARNRALIVLGITTSSEKTTTFAPNLTPQAQLNQTSFSQPAETTLNSVAVTEAISEQIPPKVYAPVTPPPVQVQNDTYSDDEEPLFALTNHREPEYDIPMQNWHVMSDSEIEDNPLPEIAPSNVTPFTPRNYNSLEDISNKTKRSQKNQPIDLSDVMAKTDVEIQRLGWTKEQGKEHLKKTYGKLGRTLMSEEELLDFLKYLESQPDPIAGF